MELNYYLTPASHEGQSPRVNTATMDNAATATESASTLTFSHLSYTAKTKTGPKALIRDLSLTVHEGEMVGEYGLRSSSVRHG
jgi:ABC-type glutathione transport system ATPase component